ncbi:hypothetical protein [Streptomyces sp. NPDC085937]|uniref:hypothetical protein n=1 Tax=Streptomyces sp. NPDC085937 TaxID=3365742 RepID=UPI0037CF1348
MESEVIAALIATPAVLVTAAAAWLAGRAQSRGAYHGPVDATRRTVQREAYADLYRSARQFINAWEKAELAVERAPSNHQGPMPQDVLQELREMYDALDALEHAVDMVRLEGPDSLAQIADRIWESTTQLGGYRLTPTVRAGALFRRNITSPELNARRNNAMGQFVDAHQELLPAARRYLNGGPTQ